MELAADFAGQASVALALAQGRETNARLALLEERARIARDLHDHVVQRLFSVGIGLQAIDLRPEDRAARAGIASAVQALDDSIAEIRSAIFSLASPDARESAALRHRIIDTVTETSAGLPSAPRVVFSGPVDLLVPDEMFADVIAVVRESLTNVAKHAQADETTLTVAVSDEGITVDVTDDGIGIPEQRRSSGTANLEHRATELGGDFSVVTRETGGTHLRWRVPLPETDT
jgi:signal transduction histidine kinase